jgi:hypothetical protein
MFCGALDWPYERNAHGDSNAHGPAHRIAIVDDDPSVRDAATTVFRSMGP